MFKNYVLRLHRWITLVFALPLLFIIGTGLVLSFQPIVQSLAITPGAVTLEKLEQLLTKYDPDNKARALSMDLRENLLSLDGVGPDGSIDIDLATGAESDDESTLSQFFSTNRRLHRQLINRMGWLVDLSTFAMLALAALGVAMGWPRLRNNVAGWHKATAWVLLPLIVLSPLTGLFLAFNVTFLASPSGSGNASGRPASGRAAAPAADMRKAVQLVARDHDLSTLLSVGNRGGRILARVQEGVALRAYAVTPQGLVATPTNWPRAFHEGTFAGVWSGLMNVFLSVAMLGLLGTGLFIWARRTLRRRPAARRTTAPDRAASQMNG